PTHLWLRWAGLRVTGRHQIRRNRRHGWTSGNRAHLILGDAVEVKIEMGLAIAIGVDRNRRERMARGLGVKLEMIEVSRVLHDRRKLQRRDRTVGASAGLLRLVFNQAYRNGNARRQDFV